MMPQIPCAPNRKLQKEKCNNGKLQPKKWDTEAIYLRLEQAYLLDIVVRTRDGGDALRIISFTRSPEEPTY